MSLTFTLVLGSTPRKSNSQALTMQGPVQPDYRVGLDTSSRKTVSGKSPLP